MKKRRNFHFQSIQNSFAVQPLIEICETKRLLIEHHRGVRHYCKNRITVSVSYGAVVVTGEGLCLRILSRETALICGKIHAIELKREEKR